TRTEDSARVLYFDGDLWRSRLLLNDSLTNPSPLALGSLPPEQQAAIRSALPSQTVPESLYAVGVASNSPSVVIASGRPEPAGTDPPEPEPRSAVITGGETSGGAPVDVFTLSTGSARLVAGDGDISEPLNAADWAVGVLRSSGQGLAYTTTRAGNIKAPTPLTCNVFTLPSPGDCQPSDLNEEVQKQKSGSLVTVDTYALNGFAFTPSGAIGWAVGDRGGIARLGGEGAGGGAIEEPDPDRVGAKTVAGVSGASGYQGLSAGAAGEVGAVPSLVERPTVKLDEPRLIPAGSPSPSSNNVLRYRVRSLVMSRDGSEGWAIAGDASGSPSQRQDTLFRYDGVRWSVCDPLGVTDQKEPDPACEDLAGLQRNDPPVQLRAAARVPLENDSDPTNDDEFEVVALGSRYKAPGSNAQRPAVLRYRDGRWSVDQQAMLELDPTGGSAVSNEFHSVVFTSPNDGWAVGVDQAPVGLRVAHYDGTRWVVCTGNNAAACGDSANLNERILPFGQKSSYVLTAAGRRVYLGGTRTPPSGGSYPFIASIDTSVADPRWEPEYDPGCESRDAAGGCVPDPDNPSGPGKLTALSVIPGPDGDRGWAYGLFGQKTLGGTAVGENDATAAIGQGSEAALLRLDPDSPECARWCLWPSGGAGDAGAAEDYMFAAGPCSNYDSCSPAKLLTLISPGGEEEAFLTPQNDNVTALHPMLQLDGERCATTQQSEGCWSVLQTPFTLSPKALAEGWASVVASAHAMAPDGQGGFWLAARQGLGPVPHPKDIFFYHYTDRMPVPVFEDAPHPIREEITDAAPGPAGELWVTTKSGVVYRYDRVLGWDRLPIPGWDRGSVITRASAANAVAVGDDGTGVVVGEGGRIAQVGPGGVRLDAAAGIPCGTANVAPCTSGHDLVSAAVADGVALAGGEGRALVCRQDGGHFQRIAPLSGAASNATITDISMPSGGEAYLTTSTGQVFVGHGGGCSWSWTVENLNEDGQLITLNAAEQGMRLNAISVDGSGRGYAVGEKGLLLERRPGASEPWRRVEAGVREDLYSVELPNGSGSGALIGGNLGLVLTLQDGRFEAVRNADTTDPITAGLPTANTARIVGLALSPGVSDGQVEAWAVSQVPTGLGRQTRDPAPGAILHYTNARDEPLLDGGMRRAEPLPDSPEPVDEELSVAAFGRSECVTTDDPDGTCREFQASTMLNETITQAAVDEILARADPAGGVDLAVFTGDVNRAAGRDSSSTPLDVDVMHRRWLELVGDHVSGRSSDDEGLPFYGAIGPQDLSQAQECQLVPGGCVGTRQAGVGASNLWRRSFAGRWPGEPRSHGELSFAPVSSGAPEAPDGGADTHYAMDIERAGEKVARLIVLDNSWRSLAGSNPQQNPTEEQQTWLQQMLCKRGSAEDTTQRPCSREPDQRALVLMNTPTYSYNTQASGGTVETASDQASLESILLTGEADAVISGRLGWNGLYYTLAPGLHFPCVGDEHPAPDGSQAPPPGTPPDCEGAPGAGDNQPGAPGPPGLPGQGGKGALPTLVASGAGGTFGPPNNPVPGDASDGFWHGYSLLHLDLETGAVRVEQRPIFDWLSIRRPQGDPPVRSLRANRRLELEGFGREAAAADVPLRYDEIDSHAITHRYDLLAADPSKPWLPATDESPPSGLSADGPGSCGPYVCLPENVGRIDAVSGTVSAGRGNYPRTFAVAQLSAGEQAATYPLTFEPRASLPMTPPPPPPPPAPVAVPPPPP
ncbi:MAG: hypothetical protein ACRDL6_11580, partial [Solirubrobacterales bacterium]